MITKPLAVQMWTFRDEIDRDLPGALNTVKEIGFDGIELWFDKWPDASALKRMIDEAGLKVAGSHVPFLELRDNFDSVADYHREVGAADLAIPILPASLRKNEDDWKRRVEEFESIARNSNDAGFRLSYHNHRMEFEDTIDGMEIHDYIFKTIGADLLKVQLDTFFLKDVGKNPADYIRRYAGRQPLLHIKEKSKPGSPNMNAEIGAGVIDWNEVFAAAEETDIEWYILEQKCEVHPPFESIRMSYEYLRTL